MESKQSAVGSWRLQPADCRLLSAYGRLCLSLRQRNADCRSMARLTLGPNRAAVRHDDLARDRQAQPGTAAAARPRAIGAVEAIEDVRQVFGGDALAGVSHLQDDGRWTMDDGLQSIAIVVRRSS